MAKYRPYELMPRSNEYVASGYFQNLEQAFDAASTLARETMHRVDLRDREGKTWCGFDFRLGSETDAREE